MARDGTRMKRARPAAAVAETAPRDRGLHHGASAPYDPLPKGQVLDVIEAAIGHLAHAGAGFESGTEAIELFRAAGCAVSANGIVRIPPDLTRECLASVAKSVRLWDRDGERYIELDNHHTWFFPGMTCIKVYDELTGEPRSSTRADLETITRVADALPNIDGACIACKNVANSDIHGEIAEFLAMAENTTKPLEYLCEHADSLAVVIEMASAIRGGREALAAKPYFLQIVTPLPLDYHATHPPNHHGGASRGAGERRDTPHRWRIDSDHHGRQYDAQPRHGFRGHGARSTRQARLLRRRQLRRLLHGAGHRRHRQLCLHLARRHGDVSNPARTRIALVHRDRD